MADSSSAPAARITYELPRTCCQAAQPSSLSPPDANHHCGAAAKTASPQAAAASAARPPRPPRRAPSSASVSTAVSPHTQWCDQEIGETSRPAKALSDSAHASAAPARARRMPRQASASTTADKTSQAAAPAGECGLTPARARTPWMDWLAAYQGLPGRPVATTTDVQYRAESRGASRNPAAVHAAKEPAAVAAAR